jgi:hypothetical protein
MGKSRKGKWVLIKICDDSNITKYWEKLNVSVNDNVSK